MSEPIKWQGRWFCPKCERIFVRRARIVDGEGFHSWRCGKNPLIRVDVTITPTTHAEDTEATATEETL